MCDGISRFRLFFLSPSASKQSPVFQRGKQMHVGVILGVELQGAFLWKSQARGSSRQIFSHTIKEWCMGAHTWLGHPLFVQRNVRFGYSSARCFLIRRLPKYSLARSLSRCGIDDLYLERERMHIVPSWIIKSASRSDAAAANGWCLEAWVMLLFIHVP